VVQKTVTKLTAGAQGTFEFELENYSIAVLTTWVRVVWFRFRARGLKADDNPLWAGRK
jgi:hypothetical protein